MPTEPLDLLCVGYLADAQVLRVDRHPPANRGTTVIDLCSSVAGDAPIVALLAVQHGLTSGLVANPVGSDLTGRRLLAWLRDERVRTSVFVHDGTRTPRLTVINDNAGISTWFAWLELAFAGLNDLDLRPAVDARMVYLDCCSLIDEAAAAAAATVTALGVPMLLNLGGDPLSPALADAVAGARIAAVQTSADEADPDQAELLAAGLYNRLCPDASIVTVGRLGALAHTDSGVHHAAAGNQPVLHTHGAGAAFSAGYVAALLGGADVPAAVAAGCRSSSAHCAQWPLPTIASRAATGVQCHVLRWEEPSTDERPGLRKRLRPRRAGRIRRSNGREG